MDEDDDFLYGGSSAAVPTSAPSTVKTSVPQPISVEQAKTDSQNGLVAHLEAQAEQDGGAAHTNGHSSATPGDEEEDNEAEADDPQGEDGEGEESDSDDDIEIILEPRAHALDFRQARPPPGRSTSGSFNAQPRGPPPPSLTTEYTPRERNAPLTKPAAPSTPVNAKSSGTPQPTRTMSAAGDAAPKSAGGTPVPATATATAISASGSGSGDASLSAEDGPDPSTLPPATAPPSHPAIDPSAVGTLEGRPVLDVDLGALAEKPWRRPGSDLSDWFNYGFDEISWEAYCYRRREMGEAAAVLKAGVMNLAGMPEDQLIALPPEIRSMVMASANTMLNNGGMAAGVGAGGQNGAMLAQGMNPMMHDMGGMGVGGMGQMGGMGMGGMGHAQMAQMGMGHQHQHPMGGMGGMGGMNGEMAAHAQMQQQMQGEQAQVNGAGQDGMGMDGGGGYGPGPGMGMGGGQGQGQGAQGMMGMGMGGEFGMQDPNGMPQGMGGGMYGGMDPSGGGAGVSVGVGTPVPVAPAVRAGGTPVPVQVPVPGGFRGRGMGLRGRGAGGFAARGRGLARPASPLPPNVPTGPRNQNKYKDRDNNAPAVDGLDYGGGKDGGGTPLEDERSTRKRRGSPSEDGRGSKRR